MSEIAALENSTESFAMIAALTSGVSGCAFMAGSVFAVTAAKPIIWLMILLAIAGFFCGESHIRFIKCEKVESGESEASH